MDILKNKETKNQGSKDSPLRHTVRKANHGDSCRANTQNLLVPPLRHKEKQVNKLRISSHRDDLQIFKYTSAIEKRTCYSHKQNKVNAGENLQFPRPPHPLLMIPL